MSRGRIAAVLIVLALVGGGAWFFLRPQAPTSAAALARTAPRPARAAAIVPGVWPDRSPQAVARGTPDGVLHYADRLDAPNQTAADDVQLLVSLLQLYRSLTHGTNPVGDNAEITAILTGKNRLGYAFIRPGHPAISADGELCDRWGTPYYFHQISGTVMQVRSAGPDKIQWTADDVVAGL